MEGNILIANMQEKKIGRGEDSDPISFSDDNAVLLGVFDGVGGAGGAEHPSDFSHDGTDMTKAYIGSRIVKDVIERTIKEKPSILFENDLSDSLIEVIKERYRLEKEKYPPKSRGGIRSALIKEYPTTLAISCITKHSDEYIVDSYWAGDSRNYIWMSDGLFQISVDDLKGNIDPLQNLHEDAPMSNCVQADASFKINHKRINLGKIKQFVVISATDGCFGYYPSPMDFENALVNSLHKSNSPDEWKRFLTKSFESVTADDFSFSIAVIGFKGFKDYKKTFKKTQLLIQHYCRQRRLFEEKKEHRRKLDKEISDFNDGLKGEIELIWPEYKNKYLKYMSTDEER